MLTFRFDDEDDYAAYTSFHAVMTAARHEIDPDGKLYDQLGRRLFEVLDGNHRLVAVAVVATVLDQILKGLPEMARVHCVGMLLSPPDHDEDCGCNKETLQ